MFTAFAGIARISTGCHGIFLLHACMHPSCTSSRADLQNVRLPLSVTCLDPGGNGRFAGSESTYVGFSRYLWNALQRERSQLMGFDPTKTIVKQYLHLTVVGGGYCHTILEESIFVYSNMPVF
ncbi:hypothetical protein F5B22DRAFT_350816 [Xylaria bambusicola]|uniref:uncharacterized protein n=1 Tax=Xylaria bambusicola TaxID=326684 RepID=UPI002008BB7A|nr:uncharacterized protein F5B22DRAFT_350816 [Xylaria bambusicola]KAI0525597.1 hypothetical protein F5B22DRAFT_350816 [Xylaria bambusicola]